MKARSMVDKGTGEWSIEVKKSAGKVSMVGKRERREKRA
jgi:hypothetical protein